MVGEVGGGILGIVSYSDSLAALLTTLYASFVTVCTVSGSLYSTQKFMIPYKYSFQRHNTYTYEGSPERLDNSNVILVESTISLCGQCNSQHT